MPTIGITELLVILLVVLVFFGPSAIPKIGKAIGEGLHEFKKAHTSSPEKKEAGTQDNSSVK